MRVFKQVGLRVRACVENYVLVRGNEGRGVDGSSMNMACGSCGDD